MINIDKILTLARLEVGEKEKKKLEEDFSSILSFVKKLEKVDVKDVKPMSYPLDIYNVMREDKTTNDKKQIEDSKKLIEAAPDKKDNYIKVKEILS